MITRHVDFVSVKYNFTKNIYKQLFIIQPVKQINKVNNEYWAQEIACARRYLKMMIMILFEHDFWNVFL